MINFRLMMGMSIAFLVFLNMGCAKFNAFMNTYPDDWSGPNPPGHTYEVELSDWWSSPVDPTGVATTEDHAEIGYHEVEGRIVSLTLEPAKAMKRWMEIDGKWMWVEMIPEAGENVLYVIKISDPVSKTRIPHSQVRITVENLTTDAFFSYGLHPMWGDSGLQYAVNKNLLGDANYAVHVDLSEPKFARSVGNIGCWRGNVSTIFFFKVKNGKVVAGSISSGTAPVGPPTPVPAHDPATLPSDPAIHETFMGEATSENMRIQLILEPARDMKVWRKDYYGVYYWGTIYATGTLYHVRVKLYDEVSGTRISHGVVTFSALNYFALESMSEELHGMWGPGGLYYAINHNLLGAGDYMAYVIVDPPLFARSLSYGDKWMDPIQADFTFTIDDTGIVTTTEGHPAL